MFGGKDPAVFFGGIGELIRAIVPMLVLFGLIVWSPEQIAAVFLVVSVCLTFLTTMFTRNAVTPTVTSDALIKTAVNMPADSTVAQVKRVAEIREQENE